MTSSTPAVRVRWVWLPIAIAACLLAPQRAHADDVKDGRAALQAGRLDEAMSLFEKASQQGSAAGRAGVGQVHLRRRQYDQAMAAFQTAQKMDPTLALALYGQGETLRRQEQCGPAVPYFEKAAELDRKFPENQLSLGDCLIQLKQHEKAVAVLNEGLKWGPKWRPRFLVGLGTAEMSRDSLRDAGIYFTKAREEAPNDPAVRRALGDFYIKRGTWALAILECQAAVALDTADVELRYSLAQALFYDKRYNEALVEYRLVTTADPTFPPAQLGMGNLLYLSGAADPRRYTEAREPLEQYVKLMPNDAKGWSLLGRTYYYIKMRDEAVEAMTKAEQLGDNSKEMYTVMGRALAEKREWDRALAAFAKGEPGSKEALLIGQMYVFKYKPGTADSIYLAKADSVYRDVVAKDPTTSDAKFAQGELGKLLFRQAMSTRRPEDFQRAIEAFQKRIELDPQNGEAYYYVGLAQKELKNYPAALEALRQAAANDSGKADRHFWLGVMLDQQKMVPEARVAFERCVALDDSSSLAGKAHRQLGFYRLLDRDWAGATSHLERAVALDGKDIQAWVWLGQGYQNGGNRGKASEAYQRALALDPNQPEASKGLKSLAAGAPSN